MGRAGGEDGIVGIGWLTGAVDDGVAVEDGVAVDDSVIVDEPESVTTGGDVAADVGAAADDEDVADTLVADGEFVSQGSGKGWRLCGLQSIPFDTRLSHVGGSEKTSNAIG